MTEQAIQQNQTETGSEALETQAVTGEVKHETSLAAEPVFNIGNFAVTNSLLNTWIIVVVIVILSVVIKKSIAAVPKGIHNAMEMIVEGALNICDSVTNSRKISRQVFPFAMTLFVFILLNNWSGLLPGIGSIGFIEHVGGESIFIPYFRGGTADFNTTLALALLTVVGANIFGIISVGFIKYFNKFINVEALIDIPFKIKKEPTIVLVNPIKFFVGLVEIIGEVAKVASLSFRLFGNIFAGEVLLSAMAVIFAFGLPIPFMALELIVGIVQAFIFSLLTLVYFTIASSKEEH